MLNDSQPTVNRRSTDGQSQRHCKQTPLSKRWKVLMTLVFLFTFAIGNVWGEDFTINPANSSNLSPGNIVKVTLAGELKIGSGQIQTNNKSQSGTFTITTTAPGLYLQTVSFTDKNSGKINSFTCTSGGTLSDKDSDGKFTFTANASTTTAIFSLEANNKGAAKVGDIAIVVTNGTTNNIVTLSSFSKSESTITASNVKCNGSTVSAPIAITSETWTISSGKLSAPSSDNSKIVTISANSGYTLKYVAFDDGTKCQLFIVETSSTGGTCNGASWTADNNTTTSVSFKNGVGAQLTIDKIYVIAESKPKHHVTYSLGGDYGTTPTQADVAEGAKFNLHNGTTGITPPTGKQFGGWNDGTTTYAGGAEYTMGTSDVTLTAVWENAKTDPTATFSAGAYVVGAAALDLSGLWSSNSDGAVTYALKEASDDASVTAGAFSATKAGSYVVTASQAATSTYNAIEKEATITVTWPAIGAADILFNIATGTDNTALGTASKEAHSTSINTLSNFTAAGGLTVSGLGAGKDGLSTKLQTLSSQDYAKYIYVTFDVAGGKEFVLDSISTKIVAVSTAKTIKIVVSDTEGTKDSLDYTQAKNSDAAHHQFNFTSSAKAYAGTVTVKIYAYGATDHYRLAQPLKVCGTVQAAATKYNVTFDKNDAGAGGTQTTLKYAEGAEVTLPGCTFTAPTNMEFDAWTSTDVTISNNKFTMPNKAVTIKATWKALVAKYTVIFKDGDVTLGTKQFDVASNPSDANIEKTKPLFTFAAWQKDDADIALDAEFWATVAKDAEVILTARWEAAYASSINVEQWVLDNGAGKGATTKTSALLAEMGTKNYLSNIAWENKNNELDTLDDTKTDGKRNYAYLGLKVKKDASNVRFLLQGGKSLKVKFGNVAATPNIKIGDAAATEMTITDGVYSLDAASGDREITISTTSAGAVVFKQIMIDEEIADVALPYLVTFNAGAGTCATAKLAGASVTLPAVTAPEDYTFAGWFDEATGGANKGLAVATYVPTDNITLYAHFDPVKYTITYAAGLGSGEMAAAEAGWGTEYTALENGFTAPTGYIFAGWTVTGVDGVSSIGNLGSFTMPKGNVTLTAIWEDNSKVAMNVETSEKYGTLAEAIAAATDGQTIQLIQDIEQADGVLIDKDLVLDLNGKTYTCTNGNSYNNRAIKITAGNVTIKNGTIDALSNASHDAGCYGGLRIEGGNVTCEEVTFKNYRIYGLGLKVTGGHLELNECTVISEIGGGLEVAGGTAEVNNCNFTQTGLDTTHKWISTCLASSEAGSLTVNGGTYTSEYSSLYIYSTGGDIDVEAGSFTGDVVLTTETTPAALSVINIKGGDFTNFEVKTPASSNCDINISGGTFDAPVENKYCADGYVPAPEVAPGVYTVEPKDGIEIIGVVTTGGSNKTVSGLYQGDASVNLDSNKKLGGDRYIYVTLASGYTFKETDVLVVDVHTMSDLTATKNLEITTGVGNINGEVWKSLTGDEYAAGLVTIPLKGIAEGQTSIGLKRSANQNAYINGLKVYRPMNPILTAITINGEACVKGEGNTFSITLPEEGTNLASLEVVPTVIRNAAHATTPEAVISNSGAWKAGDNMYRVMDKDGDYTDYTITITLQGEAPAPDITTQPVDVAYCAGSEPTLTVVATGDELHYAWYKKGDTDTQVGADQNTYTVAGAGTYYVIVTNHVDTKLDKSVTSENAVVTLNTPASITTQPTDLKKQTEGANITLSVVAANATGYQWYGCDNKDKENPVVIAGANAANYEFEAAAGFYYCEVTGLCGNVESNVAQVTVKRSAGCQYITATSGLNATLADGLKLYAAESDGKQSTSGTSFATASSNVKGLDAGAVGSINKQYILVQFPVDVEEFTIYGYNSSNRYFNNLRVNDHIGTTNADKFTSDMELSNQVVTKTNAKDGDEISMTAELNVPIAKENYVWIKFNSALEIYRICYTAAIEKPVIATQPATKIDFAAGDMTATVVVNAVTEGTLKYQWYNADGDVAVEGATSATLTTTEEGTYYVIVRNTLAGHKDYAVKSSEATLAYRQMNDATLSALSVSAGALDPTFDKAVVEYRVDLPKNTTTVPTLTATATMAAHGATAVVTNAAEFENYEAISTVLVTAEDGESQKTYTVHYYVAHAVTTLADVTESTTWDWSLVTKKADGTTISGDGPKLNENEDGLILASYLSGDDFDKLEGNDDAYAIRNSTDKKVYQGASLRMHTTKGGYLSIWAANEGHTMTLNVNNAGRDMELATLTGSQVEYKVYVQAGDVTIHNVPASGTSPMRVSKIVFTVDETPDYTRPVTNNIGTLCVEHNVLAGGALGATFYQIASRNELYNDKIDFEEVLPGEELKAGQPYIFRSNTGKIELFFGETEATQPVAVRGMIGNYAASHLDITDDNKYDILYIAQNKLWNCEDLVESGLILNDHRAYINMSDVPTYAEYEASKQNSNAPSRRRVTLGRNAEQVATGVENVQGDKVQCTKVLINGQLFILRGEKMYDATGRLVK